MTIAVPTFRLRLLQIPWRVRAFANRAAIAYRFLRYRSTDGDAWELSQASETACQSYGLEFLSAASVFDNAVDRWGDLPGLAEIVTDACERVASKWSSTGAIPSAAEDWAFELIERYAADAGVVLTERED